jgi:site-specific recombinase XerD
MTTYAAGLGVSEVVAPQVGDLDGARHAMHVRGGKGGKRGCAASCFTATCP